MCCPILQGGGAERVTLTLLRAFLNGGSWRPVLVLTTNRAGVLEDQVPPGIEVIRLGARNGRRALGHLLALIWRRRPRVVFTSLDHLNAAMGILRPFFPPETALVLRATNFQSLEMALLRRLLTFAFRQADGVVFQSAEMAEAMRRGLFLPLRDTQIVVPNPLDRAWIQKLAAERSDLAAPAPGLRRLVAVGRLEPAKGLDILIAAVAQLDRADFEVLILGQGAEEAQLRAKIVAAGLRDRVRLLGFHANPYAVMARADGVVLSSRHEGFPNVVLEALACGCPVIATPVPGLSNLPGVRLTRDISAEALAEALADFLAAPHPAEADRALAPYEIGAVRARLEMLFAKVQRGTD